MIKAKHFQDLSNNDSGRGRQKGKPRSKGKSSGRFAGAANDRTAAIRAAREGLVVIDKPVSHLTKLLAR